MSHEHAPCNKKHNHCAYYIGSPQLKEARTFDYLFIRYLLNAQRVSLSYNKGIMDKPLAVLRAPFIEVDSVALLLYKYAIT